MDDLKIIDELLCDLRNGRTWEEVERRGTLAERTAMNRLRVAWDTDEMNVITLGLGDYFDGEAVIS